MKIIFLIAYGFMIIGPYFYLKKYIPLKCHLLFNILTLLCVIMNILRVIFNPSLSFFNIAMTITLIYMFILLLWMLLLIITHFFHKNNHKWILWTFLFSILFTLFSYNSHTQKQITTYEINISKKTDLKELNIGFISDFHIGSGTYTQELMKLVSTLNQKQYDLVCFGGDLFDEMTSPQLIEDSLFILSKIETKYGIFTINGNHEIYAGLSSQDIYSKYNIQFLDDHYVCIDNKLNILGRKDVANKESLPIHTIIKDMNKNIPTIVLDHTPSRYQEVIDFADLQLSGHTHGGQIFPGQLITNILFDNDYGLLKKDQFSFITSSGYGSWGFPLRFLTRCEIVDIHIVFKK